MSYEVERPPTSVAIWPTLVSGSHDGEPAPPMTGSFGEMLDTEGGR